MLFIYLFVCLFHFFKLNNIINIYNSSNIIFFILKVYPLDSNHGSIDCQWSKYNNKYETMHNGIWDQSHIQRRATSYSYLCFKTRSKYQNYMLILYEKQHKSSWTGAIFLSFSSVFPNKNSFLFIHTKTSHHSSSTFLHQFSSFSSKSESSLLHNFLRMPSFFLHPNWPSCPLSHYFFSLRKYPLTQVTVVSTKFPHNKP